MAYYGIQDANGGYVTIECEHNEIEVSYQGLNPTLPRNIVRKSVETEDRDPRLPPKGIPHQEW